MGTLEENENEATKCIGEDVHDVEVDVKVGLQSFNVLYDRVIILFFIGRLPFVNWIK